MPRSKRTIKTLLSLVAAYAVLALLTSDSWGRNTVEPWNTAEQLHQLSSTYHLEEIESIRGHNQDTDVTNLCVQDCIVLREMLKTWKTSKPLAAIYYLARSNTREKLMDSLRKLYDNFNSKYRYPVIIFHEAEFTPYIKLVKQVGFHLIFFQEVSFEIPSFITSDVPERVHRKNIGYRHMCRFHAKMIYFHSIIRMFDYALRLDDDSYLTRPVTYDIFKFMIEHDILYGYLVINKESSWLVRGLWEATDIYLQASGLQTKFYDEWRTQYMYYNNFEISKLSIWLSDDYMNYVNFIDRLGGIYLHRWGDAPIKSIGVSIVVPQNRTHRFQNISYSHQTFITNDRWGLLYLRALLDSVKQRLLYALGYVD